MTIIQSSDANFQTVFSDLLNRGKMDMEQVSVVVKGLIDDIRSNQDKALIEHIEKYFVLEELILIDHIDNL